MLQDLVIDAEQIVAGDHIVLSNEWWKVCKIEHREGWVHFILGSTKGGMTSCFPSYGTKIRVRPYGSSSEVMQRDNL